MHKPDQELELEWERSRSREKGYIWGAEQQELGK